MIYSFRHLASIRLKLTSAPTQAKSLWLAISLMLLGVFLLDLMGVFIKYLGTSYSSTFLAVSRNFFGFIPILAVIFFTTRISYQKTKFNRKIIFLIILRGLSITLAQFCFYLALMKLEFATASTLAFASPFFLTALSIPILGSTIGIWRWSAVLVGFMGIVLIMGVGSDLFSSYAFLPLGAAFGYALSSVTVKLFPENLSTAKIQLHTQAITFLAALTIMLILNGYTPLRSVNDFLLIAAMGMSGGLGVLSLISAYRLSEPGIIAPFEYFGIPLSIFLGWLIFSEFPLSQLFPGVLFIIFAGIIIIWRENK